MTSQQLSKNHLNLKFLIISFLALCCFQQALAQKTWNPTVATAGSYLWSTPANWLPSNGLIPGPTDDVTIPSGTLLCTIPDDDLSISAPAVIPTPFAAGNPYYRCQSLTIQGNAAVYNQATAASGAKELTITNDLIINDNGYYFSGAQSATIGRDLWIQNGADTPGSPGGSFILIFTGTNKINIGRHYLNEGTMARKQITGTILTLAFNTTQNAFVYNKNGQNRDKNIFVLENLTSRTTYNFTALLTGNILKCGSFDNLELTKNKSTLENCGAPGGTYPANNTGFTFTRGANVNTCINVGVVGDGINDFDGVGGIDPMNQLYNAGAGKMTVFQGCVYVNDVNTGLAGTNNNSETVSVWDGSTTHPRGGSWLVPNADLNVRGDVEIRDAEFGVPTYNGASIDIFTASTPATRNNVTMHVGGNLYDFNITEPDRQDISIAASTQRKGLYVSPSNQIYNSLSNQVLPNIVFNGVIDQEIIGKIPNIRDYNNTSNQGQGMVLPNVIVRKTNTTTLKISTSQSMKTLRIFGDLTVYSGEFSTNTSSFLFGDYVDDEINIHAVGNPADPLYANTTGKGKFTLDNFSTMKMCTDNFTTTGAPLPLSVGAIFRGRRGGEVVMEGTSVNQAYINRESRRGGRWRMAMYSGCYFTSRYCNFAFPTPNNTGYALTGTNKPTTPSNVDDQTGGTSSNGGLKIYLGSILYNYTTSAYDPNPSNTSTNVHSLSDCVFEGANTITDLTINAVGFFRILNTNFTDTSNDNFSCVSTKTEGEIRFINSSGNAGGLNGELKDGGVADGVPDRIIWQNSVVALWRGNQSTSWNDYRNWVIADQPLGANSAFAQNVDQLVPGVGGFSDVLVIIPRKAVTNCVADVDFVINSSLMMEGNNNIYYNQTTGVSTTFETAFLTGQFGYNGTYFGIGAADKSLTVNASRSVEVKNDLILYWQTTLNLSSNAIFKLGGNLMAAYTKTYNVISSANNSTISAAVGSKFLINGDKNQQISVRASKLFNLEINKAGGTATIQGLSYGTANNGTVNGSIFGTLRLDGSLILTNGKFKTLSDTPVDIKGDYNQVGGAFDPLSSKVILRGNFTATGGSSTAGSNIFSFHPFPGAITSRSLTATASQQFNTIEFNDSANAGIYYQTTADLPTTAAPNGNPGATEAIGSNTNTVTYTLASDFSVLDTVQIYDKRVLTNTAQILKVGFMNVRSGGRLNIYSTNAKSAELQVYTDFTTNSVNILSGGRFDLLGTESKYAKITRADLLSRYGVNISGQFSARYYISEYSNDNGLYIKTGATSISPGSITVDGGGKNYISGALNTVVNFTPVYEGTGASANATVAGSVLNSVTVLNSGSGYTSAPTVVFTSVNAGETVATATAVMAGSPVKTVTITSPGTGYINSTGVITGAVNFSAPTGTPAVTATGDAIVDNQVTAINVLTGGTYTQSPDVSIAAPTASGGKTATATAILNPSQINSVVISSAGAGYAINDVISFFGDDGTLGTTALVTGIDASGGITSIGTYACGVLPCGTPIKQPIDVSVNSPGGGSGALFTVSVTATTINSFTISDGGYGYNTGSLPVVTLTKQPLTPDVDGTAASVVTNVSGGVRAINLSNAGNGYLSAATVTSITGGAGATATTTTDGGKVSSITIVTGGAYFSAPTVSFTGGGGSGATGVADTDGGTVTGFTGLVGGSGYRTAPIVTVSSLLGGIGTGASAYAKITPSAVTEIKIINGGSGYGVTKPTLILQSANPDNIPVIANETVPAGNINVSDGVIGSIKINLKGLGYTAGDILKDPGGNALFVVVADSTNGEIKTGSNPSFPIGISVSDDGSGYSVGSIINPVCVTCVGTPSGAQFQVLTKLDGVITSITPWVGLNYSTSGSYTTSPNLVITAAGSGSNFSGKPILNPGVVTSVVVKPRRRYPVASLSNGIFTNSAYGATSAALTFDDGVSFYRTLNPNVATVAPLNLSPAWTAGASPAAGYANDWDYSAASSSTGGPRIDTIYNVIFAKNPAVDVAGNYALSKNVKRLGPSNNAQNRIILKDAIGTFSGEGYDGEATVTALVAGSPNNELNPFGISADDSMVVWREPNVKRWDGGPDNLGTSWSDPQNWRPDGIPKDYNDVIIDYTLLNVDYTGSAALIAMKPVPQVPTTLLVDMNYDFTGIVSATCKSLTFNPIIQPQFAGQNQNTSAMIQMNINQKLRVAGTISIPGNTTVSVTQANNIIEVGETWTNSGTFNNGNGLVNFYKNASRAVINKLDPILPSSVDTDLQTSLNGFYKVNFSAGVSDMSSDLLALSNLSISSGATLNSNNQKIFLNGNWSNAGTFTAGQGTIFFRGSALQTVQKIGTTVATQKQDFYNVVMGKGSGSSLAGSQAHVKLLSRVEIQNGLYMLNGRIISTRSTNTTLDNGSELILAESAALQDNPSINSFVQGPVGRITNNTAGTANLHYPVGSEKQGKSFTASITVSTVLGVPGVVTAITPTIAGTGYEVGNSFTLTGGNGAAVVKVTSVNGSGGITGLNVTSGGSGYSSGAITPTWQSGSGTAVYVGPPNDLQGSVSLLNLGVQANQKTMFVVEQIEDKYITNPVTRTFPAGTNYIFEDRYWTVRDIPYIYPSVSSNSHLSTSSIRLYLSPNSLYTSISGSPLNSSQITSNQLLNTKVVKDDDRVFADIAVKDPTFLSATPSLTTYTSGQSNDRLSDGLAVMSDAWIDAGNTTGAPNVTDITNTKPIISNAFTSMGDGEFAIGLNYTALPIEGLTVTTKLINRQVQILWTVNNEFQVDKYTIEKSFDGINFIPIGDQNAKNTGSILNYSLIDKKPQGGVNYYRIKQIKTDGKYLISDVVSVLYNNELNNERIFVAYPNPLPNQSNLNIQMPLSVSTGSDIRVTLMDINGRIVFVQNYTNDLGSLSINLGKNLTGGIYILKVKTDSEEFNSKIIITD